MALLSVQQGVYALLVGGALVALVKFLRFLIATYVTPLRRLRGPPPKSLFFGHSMPISPENNQLASQWFEEYGTSFLGRDLFLVSRSLQNWLLVALIIYYLRRYPVCGRLTRGSSIMSSPTRTTTISQRKPVVS